jgi:hypothetical protein
MKTKVHYFLTLSLLGLFTASCDKSELNEVAPVNTNTTESAITATASNLIFEETFEGAKPFSAVHTMEVGTWDYALQYVTNPVYRGLKAARFEIREDQPLVKTGKRSEVTVVKGAEGDITKNTWYSFAAYFPTDGYEFDSEREVINQWYQDGSPATSLRTQKDRFLLETGNTPDSREKIDLGPIAKDTWHEFVFHFIHSHGSDGLIEVWHNGKKVLTHKGGNMYDNVLPKWKIGLYKSAFKYGTSDVDRRVIYFDNIRVGNEKATYADMTSGTTTAPDPTPEPTPTPTPDPTPEPTPIKRGRTYSIEKILTR